MPDPTEFYTDLTTNLENYFFEFRRTLVIEFNLDYINTASVKWIYSVLDHLQTLLSKGGMIDVVWKYEMDDESIEMTGEVLKSELDLPFSLKPIS